jgi:prephenate dehydratase
MTARIAFQGEPGAYSHQACREARPEMEALPCRTFEDVIEAVRDGEAELAMLPVENSTYGRVADIHSLLPNPACTSSTRPSCGCISTCWRARGDALARSPTR